ncbi:hypothetical protein ES708_09887 [subsurface metagenome]
MAEYRVPTTTKVAALIQEHADQLEQHGISGGLHAERPVEATLGLFYFSTDTGVWARANGTDWDEVFGFTEGFIQGLIDTAIGLHAGDEDAHHARYTDAEAAAVAAAQILTHAEDANAHHAAPTYDEPNEEVVFEI